MPERANVLVVEQPFDGKIIEELSLSDWDSVDAMLETATGWFSNRSGW